jgi:hypothetical protein
MELVLNQPRREGAKHPKMTIIHRRSEFTDCLGEVNFT